MKMIKIVIWDLDDTFWQGTLAEGDDVIPIQKNINLVKELVNRGIMNSIVSKNDYEKAATKLKEFDIFDFFVFPQISWNPKGHTVKDLLATMALKSENAIFIDDNPSNLAEVKSANPGINCLLPNEIYEMINLPELAGKDDFEHTRLKQYKIMEKRQNKKKEFSSNEDFLRSSHICISINNDVINEIERIEELIQRTNQLNYTKNRMSIDELTKLVNDKDVKSGYVTAWDDFGNYGIVGFFAIRKKR